MGKVNKWFYIYVVQGKYEGSYGWEDLTAEDSLREAKQRKHEYQINEGLAGYRIIQRREANPEYKAEV